MSQDFKFSERLSKLPPYLFAKLDKTKRAAMERGIDIINLGIGDPDMPTPRRIIEKLREAAGMPENHRYPSYEGLPSMREAAAKWYKKRFDAELDPGCEVLTLIGSKEGIGHIPLAFMDPGDIALIPDPGYPVYQAGIVFAGGECEKMPLLPENGFLPDLNGIPEETAMKAKMMFINYPNNPTGAVCTAGFFEDVAAFAKKYGIIVCHDAAYSEIYYDGCKSPSFLQAEGAKDVGIEFHSLSKTFNMTGWRIGFAVGNSRVIEGLGKIKTNLDSGVFQAVQAAGIEALLNCEEEHLKILGVYQERRDALIKGLNSIGWEVSAPKASFYVWAPALEGMSSEETAELLIQKAGVVATPGVGFGPHGEGFVRFSITERSDRIVEAVKRIGGVIAGR